jgi:predicted nucleotidyltransferase
LNAEAILSALVAHRVRFVIIGALGATLHGSPLRTDDVDICPDPSRTNLARLADALRELGAKEWDPRKGELVEREWDADALQVDTIWILDTVYGRLDLVFEPGGTGGYKDLSRDAVHLEIDGLEVDVASLADIIRTKEFANRDKDRAQLPTLRRLLQLQEEDE